MEKVRNRDRHRVTISFFDEKERVQCKLVAQFIFEEKSFEWQDKKIKFLTDTLGPVTSIERRKVRK